jgi:hypothetical protein
MKGKFNQLYKELEVVCKVSPIAGILGIRSLIEGIINEILIKKKFLNKEFCLNEKLGRKLEVLKGEKILTNKHIHFMSYVIYKGNDAAHLLKGSKCESKALYNDLCNNFNALIQVLEGSNTHKTKRKIGVISKITRKNIGYIEEKETKKKHLFLLDDLKIGTEVEPYIGQMLSYELVNNFNKSKSDYKAINLRCI